MSEVTQRKGDPGKHQHAISLFICWKYAADSRVPFVSHTLEVAYFLYDYRLILITYNYIYLYIIIYNYIWPSMDKS